MLAMYATYLNPQLVDTHSAMHWSICVSYIFSCLQQPNANLPLLLLTVIITIITKWLSI